jgi:hypothetical protein
MVWCGTRDAGAGATERLTRGREKKLNEKVVLVSFFLGVEIEIEIYCT